MERRHYKTDAEYLVGVLRIVLQSNGYCNYRVYPIDPFDYAPAHFEANSADASYDNAATENERDSRAIFRRPGANISGNHENVQGSWSKSSGLCRTPYNSVAYTNRVI